MVEVDLNKENEEEQSFSDPEDFVDDISDEGGKVCLKFSKSIVFLVLWSFHY